MFLIIPLYPQAQAQEVTETRQAETLYEKALISFHGGQNKEAEVYLKNALQANPRHLPSRILMAEIMIAKGDGASAEVELNFAKERGADKDRLIVLFGYSYILQNKNNYLLEVILNGKRDNNIEAEIAYLRGRAYFAVKKLANAKLSFQTALELNPIFYKAKLGLAQVAAVHKQYGLALKLIDEALLSPVPDTSAWILKAKIYKLRGFSQEALNAINQALALDDTNVLSRLTRSALLIDRKEYDAAERDVDFILAKIPLEPRAKYLKAIIDAAQGDFASTNEKMSEVIATLRSVPPEVMKTTPIYYYLAGLTNFQFGNLDDARENLQQYLKIEKNDIGAMRLLGALELQAGDPLAANVILSEAYRNQPRNPTILTLLGMSYLELGNADKANYYLEMVTKLLPDSSEGLANLARGEIAAGSFNSAINNLLKAEQHNLNSLDIKLLLIKAYQQSKQFDKAVTIARAILKLDPKNSTLLTLYGTAVGLAGDHAEARKSYEMAVEINKDDITSLIHLSRMDVIEGKSDHAISTLRSQLDKNPDNYVLMLELGNIYKALHDTENTLLWYKKAYSINGKDFLALKSLVDGYLLINDTNEALKVTKGYSDKYPKSAETYNLLGKLYQRSGNPAEAIKNFKIAVDYSVKRGEALLTLANAQLNINDRPAATKTLQKSLAWDPELPGAYIALIRIAIENADRENGLALLSMLRKISKKGSPAPDLLAGDLYAALKDYKKAEKLYLSALEIADNPVAVVGLYRIYRDTGKIGSAILRLEDWYKKYPEDIGTALLLGSAYKQAGQLQKAVDFHESLLEGNPDMPLILNNAANLNYLIGNGDKALEYASKANEKLPNNAIILDTLAWIKTRNGNAEMALPLLRKAQVLRFSDPEIKYHLAVTLDRLNRRDEAKKFLAEALASNNDFPEKTDAEKILKQWYEK